jgi:hypothetical protein
VDLCGIRAFPESFIIRSRPCFHFAADRSSQRPLNTSGEFFDAYCCRCLCSLRCTLHHVPRTSERPLLCSFRCRAWHGGECRLHHTPDQDGSPQWHGCLPQHSNLHARVPDGSGAHPSSERERHRPQRSAMPLKEADLSKRARVWFHKDQAQPHLTSTAIVAGKQTRRNTP